MCADSKLCSARTVLLDLFTGILLALEPSCQTMGRFQVRPRIPALWVMLPDFARASALPPIDRH